MATLTRTLLTSCVVVASAVGAQAGLFDIFRFAGGCSDCGEDQSAPTICRPHQANIFTYQRKLSCLENPYGEGCTAAQCGALCAPCCDTDCRIPQALCLDTGCGGAECGCTCTRGAQCHSRETCRQIAELIYASMTACHARSRYNAVHALGDGFDCCCHPEVMNALIRSMNDTDDRVRAKAADEIGDQIRRNRCCCGAPVIRALAFTLRDCDIHVRRQAEEALQLCGYRIVDGCCQPPCHSCPAQGASPAQEACPTLPENAIPLVPAPAIDVEPNDEEAPADETLESPTLSDLGCRPAAITLDSLSKPRDVNLVSATAGTSEP